MRRRSFVAGSGAFALAGSGAFALAGSGASALAGPASARGGTASFTARLAAIEAQIGGRIGVAALDTAGGRSLAHRADERFAMASSFKWILAACILAAIDAGRIRPGQPVRYAAADLLPHSPVTRAHLGEGSLGVERLAEAVVEVSDNAAANLLLRLCGGPAGLTGFLRASGDPLTRLDRTELALNSNLPGDPRDTTTPQAMIATMRRILLGDVLTTGSRDTLRGWLRNCATGRSRLRAGLPRDWVVGDKTGTGENGAIVDFAWAWPPPTRAPILIACCMSGSRAPLERLEAAQAGIGALVAAALG